MKSQVFYLIIFFSIILNSCTASKKLIRAGEECNFFNRLPAGTEMVIRTKDHTERTIIRHSYTITDSSLINSLNSSDNIPFNSIISVKNFSRLNGARNGLYNGILYGSMLPIVFTITTEASEGTGMVIGLASVAGACVAAVGLVGGGISGQQTVTYLPGGADEYSPSAQHFLRASNASIYHNGVVNGFGVGIGDSWEGRCIRFEMEWLGYKQTKDQFNELSALTATFIYNLNDWRLGAGMGLLSRAEMEGDSHGMGMKSVLTAGYSWKWFSLNSELVMPFYKINHYRRDARNGESQILDGSTYLPYLTISAQAEF